MTPMIQSHTAHVAVMGVYARVSAWDLSIIKMYAVNKGLYSADEIDAIEEEYKRFIALAFSHRSPISISQKIDQLWHTHILFTQDYIAMCESVGGRYLHHRPSILDGGSAHGSATSELYQAHFGAQDTRYWGSAEDCDSEPQCRPCDTDPNEVQTTRTH